MKKRLFVFLALLAYLAPSALAQDEVALFAAIENKDPTAVRIAIEAGSDVNAVNASGASPLFAAVQNQSLDICRLLVASGADVNFANTQNIGATPLMMAAAYQEIDIVNLLLENDADVNLADINDDPAINWAAYYGYTDIAERLLKAGANTQQVGHGNPRQIAMRRGHQSFVGLMARVAGIELPSPDTALLIEAIRTENVNAVDEALSLGASANAADFTGRPILELAARSGNVDIVQRLISAGADVDAADEIGFTALMEAARDGKTEVVEYLLTQDVDVNRRSEASALHLTPMHMAAISGDAAIVSLLAEAGAKVDPQGRDGGTPMMWALGEGKMNTVDRLLELGANPTLKNKAGFSVLDYARQVDDKNLLSKMGHSSAP